MALITVPVSACCGALPGDVCDCGQWAAEAAQVLAGQDPTRPVITMPAPGQEAA